MKTLIIYSSIHHNNTEKIARTMAVSINADIIETKDFAKKLINS